MCCEQRYTTTTFIFEMLYSMLPNKRPSFVLIFKPFISGQFFIINPMTFGIINKITKKQFCKRLHIVFISFPNTLHLILYLSTTQSFPNLQPIVKFVENTTTCVPFISIKNFFSVNLIPMKPKVRVLSFRAIGDISFLLQKSVQHLLLITFNLLLI